MLNERVKTTLEHGASWTEVRHKAIGFCKSLFCPVKKSTCYTRQVYVYSRSRQDGKSFSAEECEYTRKLTAKAVQSLRSTSRTKRTAAKGPGQHRRIQGLELRNWWPCSLLVCHCRVCFRHFSTLLAPETTATPQTSELEPAALPYEYYVTGQRRYDSEGHHHSKGSQAATPSALPCSRELNFLTSFLEDQSASLSSLYPFMDCFTALLVVTNGTALYCIFAKFSAV